MASSNDRPQFNGAAGALLVYRVMIVSNPGGSSVRSREGEASVTGSRAPLYPAQIWTVWSAPGNAGIFAGNPGIVAAPRP